MGYTVQLRRATAARWLEIDPILEDGEPGIEKDTFKIKFGDGTSLWSELEYSGGESSATIEQATEIILGGIKAAEKTTESQEVKIDPLTGKLYVPASGEAANGVPGGGTAGQMLSKIDGVDFNAQWVDVPNASQIGIVDLAGNFTSDEIEGALSELFTSVSDGKDLIATAITDKGGTADGSDTFQELATEIVNLPSGGGEGLAIPVYKTYSLDTFITQEARPISMSPQIPVMTSNILPSGIASANSGNAYLAFNGSMANFWQSIVYGPWWIAYEFVTAKCIRCYTIVCPIADYPTAWTFEGWDGANWIVLDTVVGAIPTTLQHRNIDNNSEYIKYRLSITGYQDDNDMRINYIQMYETVEGGAI